MVPAGLNAVAPPNLTNSMASQSLALLSQKKTPGLRQGAPEGQSFTRMCAHGMGVDIGGIRCLGKVDGDMEGLELGISELGLL